MGGDLSAHQPQTDRDHMVRCLIDGVASRSLQREAAHELERAWQAEGRMYRDLVDTQDALRAALHSLGKFK